MKKELLLLGTAPRVSILCLPDVTARDGLPSLYLHTASDQILDGNEATAVHQLVSLQLCDLNGFEALIRLSNSMKGRKSPHAVSVYTRAIHVSIYGYHPGMVIVTTL